MKHAIIIALIVLLASVAYGQASFLYAVLFSLLFVAVSSVEAAEYCLSPEGDDDAVGDRENPWRTIGKSNEMLRPENIVEFLPGEYLRVLAPANSGTKDAPITYRFSEPRAARLVGEGKKDLITLNDREHITIETFLVDGRM